MFFEIERILKGKIDSGRPVKGFLLENVEGLINHENGDTLKTIISHLVELGYQVNYKLIDAQYFGLAQSRKRVYIVGSLTSKIELDDFKVQSTTLGEILDTGLPVTNESLLKRLCLDGV